MTPRTYTTTQILALAGSTHYFYRLNYLVLRGKVTPLNKGRGTERLFSGEEAIKAINILRGSEASSIEELEKMANGE